MPRGYGTATVSDKLNIPPGHAAMPCLAVEPERSVTRRDRFDDAVARIAALAHNQHDVAVFWQLSRASFIQRALEPSLGHPMPDSAGSHSGWIAHRRFNQPSLCLQSLAWRAHQTMDWLTGAAHTMTVSFERDV
jgi:hypothetical protein